MDRWDPLTDPLEAHAPADGSDGVVVGDDTGQLPRVRVPPAWPWQALAADLILAAAMILAGLAAVVFILILAAPVVGNTVPAPIRSDPACRCGARPT